jgi:hypothetical protein
MISDVCPECGTDHIDVQSLSFAKVHARALRSRGVRESAGPAHLAHPGRGSITLAPSPPPAPHPQVANPDIGRIKTQYRRVECTPPTDMQISVMDFRGAGGWIRLNVEVSPPCWRLAFRRRASRHACWRSRPCRTRLTPRRPLRARRTPAAALL